MSTEIIWVNRNLAVLAPLHRLRIMQPAWSACGDRQCRVTLACGDRAVSILLNRSELIGAWKGSEADLSAIIRTLAQFMRSLTE